MTSFNVDLDELAAVLADMERFQGVLERHLSELGQAVDTLHGTWSGAAAEAQKAAHQKWHEGATAMHQALGEMRDAGQRAHGNYTSAATANTQMWSQTR